MRALRKAGAFVRSVRSWEAAASFRGAVGCGVVCAFAADSGVAAIQTKQSGKSKTRGAGWVNAPGLERSCTGGKRSVIRETVGELERGSK